MRTYKCGIIGLGRQGAGYPEPYPVDKPRSHKEAYEMHPKCELVFGNDIVPSRRFGDFYLNNFEDSRVDIVSVCTPFQTSAVNDNPHPRLQTIRRAYEHSGCRAIFCEKPLAQSIEECGDIVSYCKKFDIVLAVNHQRAWGLHGEIVYGGDPLVTGTHAADLARRMGMKMRRNGDESGLNIELRGFGPGVSLKAIDDIIDCIEGYRWAPRCSGRDALRAVEMALAS